ncbi:SDR family NAD(P)-dependent oxidoreductase [Streptomyces syringium]|uniref:SDR family NAD(P)-dependent oxidoreductase n=1 Tax=Streptomyces syringium TaxID=76729 RepID=UPI0033D6D4C0
MTEQSAPRRTDLAIAVVGAACRLPGGINAPDELWTALEKGRDLVTEVPADRFDASRFLDPDAARSGKSYTAAGGFLDGITGFDPGYFGISPREAAHMDPQQRLLLEMAAEALDEAGMDADRAAGSDTAVFVGSAQTSHLGLMSMVADETDAYTMTGGALSIIANRLSYALDLRGPSMVVDTACSSALVAVHQACEALRSGRSRMAFAGGIGLLTDPFPYIGFSKASMLSPTGRCRVFSTDADGFVRAEGGGLFLLKPLADAVADGDRVHAVIETSGINTDGRTQGLALPSSGAQEALLRRVYEDAGVGADELVYFEAHGTGTQVGDFAECRAVGRALGRTRTVGPLPIGAVKSNLGHLEAASGVPGLLKAILVLRHRRIPQTLHAEPLSADIDFAGLGLEPALRPAPLPVREGRGLVGVNSFGFGGANAHVVLGPAPVDDTGAENTAGRQGIRALPVMVSARSQDALAVAVQRMADHLEDTAPGAFYDTAYTATCRRTAHAYRAAVLARTPQEAADRLRQWASSLTLPPAPVTGRKEAGGTVFAFSGNGSQWPGMGAQLLDEEAAFRGAVEEADAALAPLLGHSVIEEMTAPAGRSRMDRTEVAQPALFAVQLGLVTALAERGVRPDVVLGHSVGEIAAAHVAGALDLPTAAHLVAVRSRLQATTAGTGRMAALGLPEEEARTLLLPYGGRLEIAAVNSSRDVTVSGQGAALAELAGELEGSDVFFRPLDLDYPYHSGLMDGLAEPMRQALSSLRPGPLRLPFASTVTGLLWEGKDGTRLDAGYWWQNLRQPVLFHRAATAALGHGCGAFIEIGPHPVLKTYLRRAGETAHRPADVLPTLQRHRPGPDALDATAAGLLTAGAGDRTFFFPAPGKVTDLPPYPWQREEYPLPPPQMRTRTCGDGTFDHPLLGERAASLEPSWHQRLDAARLAWVADHQVDGSVLMPAAGYIEMALAAGTRVFQAPVEVTALTFQPLTLPWREPDMNLWLHTSLSDEDGLLRVAARNGGPGRPWHPHARGRVRRLLDTPPRPLDLKTLGRGLSRHLDAQRMYQHARRIGLDYGPSFRVLHEVRTDGTRAIARYRADHLDPTGYLAHPVIVDGALQAGAALLDSTADTAFLPAAIDDIRAWRPAPTTGYVQVHRREGTSREVVWDVALTDGEGTVCLELIGCRLRSFDAAGRPPLHTCTTELRLSSRPHTPRAEVPLPALDAIKPTMDALYRKFGVEEAVLRGIAMLADLKRLTAHYTYRALTEMAPDHTSITWGDLEAAGVLPAYRPLLDVLVAVAQDHGLLTGADSFRTGGPCRPASGRVPQISELFTDTLLRGPEAAVFGLCGRWLPDVLTGRCDPLELMFSESGRHLIEELYTSSAQCWAGNLLFATCLESLVGLWPAGRPLRILEVGAGTGSTTAAVLPHLPQQRVQYVFTDVSEAFFPRARARLAAYDFVEYRTLDLDRDPAEQGWYEGSFDIVIAANVLHATQDVRRSLHHLAHLLADGGYLFAQEVHDVTAYALVFGLLTSFWNRTDIEERPTTPLLPQDRWHELLLESGFSRTLFPSAEGRLKELLSRFSGFLGQRERRAAPLPPPPLPSADSRWIIAARPGCPLAPELAGALTAAGATVRITGPGTDEESWNVPDDTSSVTAVLLADTDTDAAAVSAQEAVTRSTCYAAALRAFATATAHLPAATPRALWLVAPADSRSPSYEPSTVAAAAAWGMARTLANEHPDVTVRRLAADLDGDPRAVARQVAAELLDLDDEDEIVLTPGGRYVPRLTNRMPSSAACTPTDGGGYALYVRQPGPRYRLVWRPEAPPAAPGPDEMTVQVRAGALNYRDVLHAQGIIPQPTAVAGSEHPAGFECAGVVTAVGERVTGFAPGDRVYAMSHGALRSHLTIDHRCAGPIPHGMGFVEAATLPIAFLTAEYALGHAARLAPGQTVLIHAAAGGVGLAAVQYAQRAGAHVIATAGTPHKRNFLHMLGIEHVADSRSLGFAEQVRAATGGQGVDVVLNSLSGEAVSRSLELLKPGGRFIELGIRDFHTNERLLLRPFLRALSFSAVELATTVLSEPREVERHFSRVVEAVTAGALRPLPHWVRPAGDAEQAFTLMRHSRHIGKLVLTLDDPPQLTAQEKLPQLEPHGTYLVTGGLGGFGAATARWLAERGARHLALVGRRGCATPGADRLLEDLRGQGVHATAHAVDAADIEAMRTVFEQADDQGHPVRGVVHAAMHLDDAPLADLDDTRVEAVLRPKIGGALVLDELTRGRELDLFILYSSIATLIGNPHQTPYAGANLALEALARARRRRGEPGVAVAWGAIGETGYIARMKLDKLLEGKGLALTSPQEALARLGHLLTSGTDVAAVGRMRWEALRSYCPTADAPRLSHVVNGTRDVTGHSPKDLRRRLATLSPEEARALALTALAELAAAVLQTTPERVPADRPLAELGMDSLMAAELAVNIRHQFDCEVSSLQTLTNPTLTDLADLVLTQHASQPTPVTAPTQDDAPRQNPAPVTG